MIDDKDRSEGLMVRQATWSPRDTRTHIERLNNDSSNAVSEHMSDDLVHTDYGAEHIGENLTVITKPAGMPAGAHGVWRGRD